MEDLKKHLEHLLLKDDWTTEERQWMLRYLNSGDLSGLRLIAREQYRNDLDMVKGHIEKRLSKEILHKIHERIPAKQRPAFRLPLKAAAVAAIVILGLSFWIYRHTPSGPGSPVFHQMVSTSKGERKEIRLADGTKVWLSPASRLEYPDKFRKENREVILTGEAFFEVTRDEGHPFIIRSGSLETKVLGTSFNISAYQERNHIAVTVLTGKVSVSAIPKDTSETSVSVEVIPHEKALFNKTDQSLIKEKDPNAARMLARRDGLLVYNGTPLAVVADDLSMQYDTVIRLEGNMATCGYYGNFNTSGNLEDALQQICLTINGTLYKEEDGYVIRGDGC